MRTSTVIPTLIPILLFSILLSACDAERRNPSNENQTRAEFVNHDPGAFEAGDGHAMQQMVYVPVYSHIFYQDESRSLDLAATLSVRNTDPERSITIHAVRYYDSLGKLVRRHLSEPLDLGPLASTAFVVTQKDQTGGVGANFLVEWRSAETVSQPRIEAVMIGTGGTQGISFVTEGQIVRPLGAEAEAGDGR